MRKMSTKTFKSNKGFTLVELVVVITILAILAVVAINGVGGIIAKSKASADLSIASNLGTAAAASFADNKIDFGGAAFVIDLLETGQAAGTISGELIGEGKTYTTVPQVQGIRNGYWYVRVTTAGGVEVLVDTVNTRTTWPTTFAATDTFCVLYPKDNSKLLIEPYVKLK